MVYNYLKIALRNLRKYKFISFINLFGLTIGLSCCLLILAYIVYETSYEDHNPNASRTYRVTRQFNSEEGKVWLHLGTISPPFAPLLKNDFPEIEKMTRLINFSPVAMMANEKVFNQNGVFVADENLFDIFNAQVIVGNPATALKDPFTVMLSEENAKKYFGNDDPINKYIKMEEQFDFRVTGVFKSFPSNSHIHPEILLSAPTLRDSAIYGEENLRSNWGNNSFFTYIRLPANVDPKNMESRFPAFLDKHFPRGENSSAKPSKITALFLQRMTDIHLKSHLDYEAEENSDIRRVYIFSIIALFILLIACINYMNLATARSVLRAKEIGVRKVAGALRKEIILQFLSESVLMAVFAMLMAIGICILMLPYLNKLSGLSLNLKYLAQPILLGAVITIPFVVGLISGIYPALFMSSFRPIAVLKGFFKFSGSRFSFRQVLVVAQFSISIILIVCTAIVFRQLDYIQSRTLGFDKEHIVNIPYNIGLNNRFESFRNELLTNLSIKDVGRSTRIPTGRLLDAADASIPMGDSLQPVKAEIKMVAADYSFITTYGIAMKSGRNFSRDYATDSTAFIINEAAVAAIGWKSAEDAIGKAFRYGEVNGRIIGVTKDMHFESLHESITPLVFFLLNTDNGRYNQLSIKIAGTNTRDAIAAIQSTWKKFLPNAAFDYVFLQENFDRLYRAETVQGQLFTLFAGIAIFIACLGLFGLSAFTISQRVKEIGIRKVLGADSSTIVALLSKDFLKLVVIAALIAFPIAWYSMHEWLKDFAYRSTIQWWIFILAGLVAALVALVTIGFQAIRAANANPVKSLKTE